MFKCIFIFLLCIFVKTSLAKSSTTELNEKSHSILKGFRVADQKTDLHFKHHCSDIDHHDGFSRSAYSFFSTKGVEQKPIKALVLAEVAVGWLSGTDVNGLQLELEKMQVEGLNKWAGKSFSIALEIQNKRTQELSTGAFSKTYFYSYAGSGYPVDKEYTISKTGSLKWEKLIEPEDAKSQTSAQEASCCETDSNPAPVKKNEYKGSEGIQISQAKIKNPEDPHTLYLIFKNTATGQKIKLRGPNINKLKELLNIPFARPRILTWGVLNPLQEGGLWDVISDAFKYGDCIYLRKKAKKDFDKLF